MNAAVEQTTSPAHQDVKDQIKYAEWIFMHKKRQRKEFLKADGVKIPKD